MSRMEESWNEENKNRENQGKDEGGFSPANEDENRSWSANHSRSRSRSRDKRSSYSNDKYGHGRGTRGGHRDSRDRSESRSPPRRGYPRQVGMSRGYGGKMIPANLKDGKYSIPTWDRHISKHDFIAMQSSKLPREKLNEAYEKYEKKFYKRKLEDFYEDNKGFEWFQEKYTHEKRSQLENEKKEEAKRQAQIFEKQLASKELESINLEITNEIFKNKISLSSLTQNEMGEEMKGQANGGAPGQEGEQGNLGNTDNGMSKTIELGEDFDVRASPYFGFDPNYCTLFIKKVPQTISRWDLLKFLTLVKGFLSLSLSDALKTKDYMRYGWILFDSEENRSNAENELKGMVIGKERFEIVKSKMQVKKIKYVTKMDKFDLEKHLAASKELIRALDSDKGIQKNFLLESSMNRDKTVQFDLQVLYLRKVHSYCYYSIKEYLDERMLSAKCGVIFLRGRIPSHVSSEIPDWSKLLLDDSKKMAEEIKARSECKDRLAAIVEKEKDKLLDKEIKNFKEGATFKCKHCHKHYKNKHADYLEKLSQKASETAPKRLTFEYMKADLEIIVSPSNSGDSHNKMGGGMSSNRGYQYKDHGRGRYDSYDRRGRGGYGQGRMRREQRHQYEDLDDPNTSSGRSNKMVIDYNDL